MFPPIVAHSGVEVVLVPEVGQRPTLRLFL